MTVRPMAPPIRSGAIGLTVMMILAHIVLNIGAGVEDVRRPPGETERSIRGAARRSSAGVLAIGAVLIGGLALISAPAVVLMQATAAVFILASMARYGSELFYSRGQGPRPALL